MTKENKASATKEDIENLGNKVDDISVQLGAGFLEHFSEQLYSSPNKAFEELVANSWDAGAQSVYVQIPSELYAADATIFVLDDGFSMDAAGLHDLWKVADSSKRDSPPGHGRPIIGKFGIGKLATYVLANKLTYICKAKDGKIRLVTMNYGKHIKPESGKHKLIKDIVLEMREVEWSELEIFLHSLANGPGIVELIKKNVPTPTRSETWENEYGHLDNVTIPPTGTWTLVVLENLKQQGRDIKRGVVRRMLQTSLPLGAELNIVFNNNLLNSSKLDIEILREWVIGKDFVPDAIVVPPEPGDEETAESEVQVQKGTDASEPSLILPEIGKVTGKIKLYLDKISGGKSEELAASNGFFVNVLGRVTNNDPAFGEKDLSHSAWARFRMTVRADGLDSQLAVNREQFRVTPALRLFKAFLRKGFNVARSFYDDVINAAWPETGKVIIDSWGTLPLRPLRDLVAQNLSGPSDTPDLIDESGIKDKEEALHEWEQEISNDFRNLLKSVSFEVRDSDSTLARYRVLDRSIIVNSAHPFVQEHFATQEEKRTVRNFALLDLLTDTHAISLGVDPAVVEEVRTHRDRISRLIAQIDRRSGVGVARILIEVSTYKDYKALEILLGDALEYLGFAVERMAASGEPEGLARAFPTPTGLGKQQSYSFSYDAKSSKWGRAKTGNVKISGLKRHRKENNADFALVVAPDFEKGALESECKENQITPMRARDLGRLLQIAAQFGAIPLTRLKEVFALYDPDEVEEWVSNLEKSMQSAATVTLDLFVQGLKAVDKDIPDVLSASLIADKCRQLSGNKKITEWDILSIAKGLQILVPDLMRVERKQIYISAHPDKLGDSIAFQLQRIKTASAEEFLSTNK